MSRQIVAALLLAFLAVAGVNWPELPFHVRLADLLFIPLVAALLADELLWHQSSLQQGENGGQSPNSPRLPWRHAGDSPPFPGHLAEGPGEVLWHQSSLRQGENGGQSPRLWRRADVAVALYLLGSVPAIVVSADQRASVLEFVRQIYLAAIYFVIAFATSRGFARSVSNGLALGGAMLAIGGLIFIVALRFGAAGAWAPMGEVMPLPYIGDTLRLRALTASEAMLACVLTGAIPFAIAACASHLIRRWCVATMAMLAAALLTFSHAVAGVAVATVIAVWPYWSARPNWRRLAAAGAVLVVLALNFAATISIRSVSGYADVSQYHHTVDARETRIGDTTIRYDVMSYARIKQVAWRAFTEHPIAGIGLNRFYSETERAFNEGWLPALYREIDPHSTLPGRLAETGLIGGITLVWLWIAWGSLARDAIVTHPAIGIAATAALVGLIVSSLNADIMNFRFLWAIAGLLRGLQDARAMTMGSGRDDTSTAGTD